MPYLSFRLGVRTHRKECSTTGTVLHNANRPSSSSMVESRRPQQLNKERAT
uniref:GSVIVT01027464001 n=1 Tax=Arundo donax TaxID=35708 RepID=A0A0A9FHC3_ARUDO